MASDGQTSICFVQFNVVARLNVVATFMTFCIPTKFIKQSQYYKNNFKNLKTPS